MSVQITGTQIKNGAINSDRLSTGAVATDKISDNAVTSAKIADSSILESKLASSSISTAKLQNNSVTSAKIDLTGTFNFSNGTLQAGTPSNSSDVANKSYVDGLVGSGVYWKEPARVASTGNVNISNPGTDTFDGVQIASGDRIVLKDQSTSSENGVYDFNGSSSALTRSSDANSAEELNGLAIFVKEGSNNADQGFVQTSEIATLGSDNVVFVQFTGLGQITAGDGLDKSGNTLSVDVGAGLQISGSAVAVEAGSGLFIDTNAVAVDVDDSTIQINGTNKLEIKDGGITSAKIGTNQVTGNEIAAGTVATANLADSSVSSAKLAASSVTEAKLSSLSVSEGKIQSSAVTPSKLASSVAGDGLTYNSSTGLAVGVDDSTIEINLDSLRIKDLGVVADKLALNSVTSGKIASDAVTPSKLAASCAGSGLGQDQFGALQVSVSDGLEILSDAVTVKNGAALDFSAGALDVQVDDATIEVDSVSNQIRIKDLGIGSGKIQSEAITTAKIADDAVTAAKVGFQAYQELTSISGSTTTYIDLARYVYNAFSPGIMVFKNGLALLNQSALGGSASNNDEFTISVVASVTRLTFGAALNDGDSILVVYMT
jgi:hypothetical protein